MKDQRNRSRIMTLIFCGLLLLGAVPVVADELYFADKQGDIKGAAFVDNAKAKERIIPVPISVQDAGEEIEDSYLIRFPIQFSRRGNSAQCWSSPDIFMCWTTGVHQGQSELLLLRDRNGALPQHQLITVKEGQAPTQMMRLSNVFMLGSHMIGMHNQGKVIIRETEGEQKPLFIGKIQPSCFFVRMVAFKDTVFMLPFWMSETNGNVLFRTSFKWTGEKLLEASEHFIDTGTARLIAGELWGVNGEMKGGLPEGQIKARMNVFVVPGFEEGEYYYCNFTSGALVKVASDKFTTHTWVDTDQTDLTIEPLDSGSNIIPGIVKLAIVNPIDREIWMMRNPPSADNHILPIREDGREWKERFPTVDVLDEDLNYKHTLRLIPPAEFKQFAPKSVFCTSEGTLYMFAYTKRTGDKRGRTGFVKVKLNRGK